MIASGDNLKVLCVQAYANTSVSMKIYFLMPQHDIILIKAFLGSDIDCATQAFVHIKNINRSNQSISGL